MAKLFFILFLIFVICEQLFYFYKLNKKQDKNSKFFVFTTIISVIALYLFSIYC